MKSSLMSLKPIRWSSRTLFPIRLMGKPFDDSSGEPVILVHFLGWNKKYDQVIAVRDLIPLKGQMLKLVSILLSV